MILKNAMHPAEEFGETNALGSRADFRPTQPQRFASNDHGVTASIEDLAVELSALLDAMDRYRTSISASPNDAMFQLALLSHALTQHWAGRNQTPFRELDERERPASGQVMP